MKKHLALLLILLAGMLNHASAQGPCSPGQSVLRLELDPDYYWYEVAWQVKDIQMNSILFSGSCSNENPITRTYCIPAGSCIEFTMFDQASDGIYPDGNYKLFLNDTLIFENATGIYGAAETTTFGCPPGVNCSSAIPLELGAYTTLAGGLTSWYEFTPQENGIYHLSTCDSANTCPTKIWTYGVDCGYIEVYENNLGTLFYSESGCPGNNSLAQSSMFLAGGETYYFRIGYANGATCAGTPIEFELTYNGPITGCTDSLACNYEPLATISGDCIYPGDPNCPSSPDLWVLEDVMKSTFTLAYYENSDPCAVEEGCIRGFGARNIIRFDTHIKNIGDADYFIGVTPSSPSQTSNQFVYDPCHNHWHYRGYAEYVLYDAEGHYVPVGAKNGFCVLDLECDDGGNEKYTCENMGISANCGDIYEKSLECQWIDITDLPAGQYTFVMRVNWDKSPDKAGRVEKSFDNNWAQACFQLTYGANGAPDVELIEPCVAYVDCMGVPYGPAEEDCEAVCNGTALFGDVNKNLERDTDDILFYMNAALTDTTAASNCRDLYADLHLDIYDAALLQECMLHGDSVAYWGTRFACEFPTGKDNPNDLVYLRLGQLDTTAHTLDILINNPFNKLLAYEFEMSGLVIESVENLDTTFDATIVHNSTRIAAMTLNEKCMVKHAQQTPVVRIHYSEITNPTVCIDSVIAVVNDKYIRSNAKKGIPGCVEVITSSAPEAPTAGAFPVAVMPNPALTQVSVFFKNDAMLPTDITLTDLQGRTLRTYKNVYDNTVTLTRQDLPGGVYLLHLRNENGLAVAKLIWQ